VAADASASAAVLSALSLVSMFCRPSWRALTAACWNRRRRRIRRPDGDDLAERDRLDDLAAVVDQLGADAPAVGRLCEADGAPGGIEIGGDLRRAVDLVPDGHRHLGRAAADLGQVIDLGEVALGRLRGRCPARQVRYGGPLYGPHLKAHDVFLLEAEQPVHGPPSLQWSALLSRD
jgi:hypothetical protein